jgi:hypothetical protein
MKELDSSISLNELTNSCLKEKELSCLNTVGLYIIEKLREEDLKETSDSISLEETKSMSKVDEEGLKSKIDIVELILNNRDILVNLDEFYEEDCQISLLSWALETYKKFIEKKIFLMKKNITDLNNDLLYKNNCLNNKAEILLFNILNIFEIFPIKPDDLKSLNFIEKLRYIKKDMKTYNLLLYKKIKKLIKFWKKMIKFFDSQKPLFTPDPTNFEEKRQREDCDTAKKDKNKNPKFPEFKEENENMSSNISLDETDSCDNKIKKKNVTWKTNELLVEKIEFDPNNAPFKM